MLCGSLDGRGVWGRMDACICTTEFPCCLPETITTLLIGYTPKQNKKFPKKQKSVPEIEQKKTLVNDVNTGIAFSPKVVARVLFSLFISIAHTGHSHFVDCDCLMAIKAK